MHGGCGGVLGQRGSEVVEGALLVSSSYSAHGLDVGPRKLDAALACSDSVRWKRGCDMTAEPIMCMFFIPSMRDPTSSAADIMILHKSMYLSARTAFGVSKF